MSVHIYKIEALDFSFWFSLKTYALGEEFSCTLFCELWWRMERSIGISPTGAGARRAA